MAYGIVYVWTCTKTNMSYVGQTVNSLEVRWKGHCKAAFKPHCAHWELYKAIREHGAESFVGRVVQECSTAEELATVERRFITDLNTMWPAGYNMRNGSNQCSDVTRAKMRQAKIGKSLPARHKQRISEALAGHPNWGPEHHTDETKKKQSASHVGKKPYEMTDEIRQKISQSKKGTVPWNKGKRKEN